MVGFVDVADREPLPHPRAKDFVEHQRLRGHRHAAQPAARIGVVAAPVAGEVAGPIGIIGVKRAPLLEGGKQQFLVLG